MRSKRAKDVSVLPVFTERFQKLVADRGNNLSDFAMKSGIQRQTLNSYKNENYVPDCEKLKKICVAADVSADYMIGLSDTKKPDASARAVCEYTGLTEEAVESLSQLSKSFAPALNYFLTADPVILQHLFGTISAYLSDGDTLYPGNGGTIQIPKDIAKPLAKYYAVQHFEDLFPDE